MASNCLKKRSILCSIVIPVYKSIVSLAEIAAQVEELEKTSGYSLELIFVNDSPSFAPTRDALNEVENLHDNVTVIELRKNQGQHLATIVGMGSAKGDYVITMDDDLQHPVAEIPKLIRAMQEDKTLDAVFAVPGFENRKHSSWKVLGSYTLSKIDTLFLDKPKGLVKSSFRIMTKSMADLLTRNYNATPSISSLIICFTGKIKNITVSHHQRPYGKSNYGFFRLFNLSLNNILHYSAFPLKMVGTVGLITFVLSIGFVSITIARKLMFNIAVPGFTTIITLTGILGGMNLLAVGIIGEYLLRILKEQQKPKINDLMGSHYRGEKNDREGNMVNTDETPAEKQS
jgi:dolichol-phosphate mannosyltransferase/undecaprenyl-phosphate 4-deoxy-4-formamido-L-arabinose transferase